VRLAPLSNEQSLACCDAQAMAEMGHLRRFGGGNGMSGKRRIATELERRGRDGGDCTDKKRPLVRATDVARGKAFSRTCLVHAAICPTLVPLLHGRGDAA